MGAAIIGLPQEVNYGLLAVAPLGAAFAGRGIAAALYGSVLAVLVALALGAGRGRITGPRPSLSILLAGLFATLQQQPGMTLAALPAFAALVVFLAGLTLVGAARIGLGRLIKYVPVPVLAGFTNGVAAMLLLSALPVALGAGLNAGRLADWLPAMQPAALLVTGLTVCLCLRPCRLPVVRQVPGIVQALLAASLLHLLLLHGIGLPAGPPLGNLAADLPGPDILLGALVLPAVSLVQLGIALKFALAIAMTAALETLATSATIDAQLGERTSGNGELQRLGIAMLCLSPLGMPVAGSLGRSTALLSTGASSRLAHGCYALCLLGLAVLGYALISRLPQAAVAGILIVVARNMVGQSLREAVAEVRQARNRAKRNRSAADFLVMLLVAFVTVADSFVTGLAAGIVGAMALFIRDQSLSVIRRVQFGNRCHSLRLRSPEARAVQLGHGREIAVIEAQGVLFFGSAERLGQQVESLAAAREIVVDLRRVGDIDATASRLLEQTARRLRDRGGQLILSHLAPASRLYDVLIARGLPAAMPLDTWFADLDSALEYAEDRLLARHGIGGEASRPLDLGRSDLAAGLSAEQLACLESYLTPRRLAAGEILFRQGESGDSLFVVTRGAVSIHLPQAGGHGKRLIAFGPGAVLGEMALVTGAPRSADALADEESELLELENRHFRSLEHGQPTIAAALLRAIAGMLADRLRDTTGQLNELSGE